MITEEIYAKHLQSLQEVGFTWEQAKAVLEAIVDITIGTEEHPDSGERDSRVTPTKTTDNE